MTEDNPHNNAAPKPSNSTSDTRNPATEKRLEDLLIDDEAPKTTFRELADQEVKRGKSGGGSLRWPFVILTLLFVAVVGVVVGWYQYGDLFTAQSGTQEPIRVEKRMTAPERPQAPEATEPTEVGVIREVTSEEQGVAADTAEQDVADVTVDEAKERVEEEAVAKSATASPTAIAPVAIANDVIATEVITAEGVAGEAPPVEAETASEVIAEPIYRVLVGPFISPGDLERAAALLRERGLQPQQQRGSGTVDMIRLLEGIYPLAQAQLRLEEIRKDFSSAFLLPDGDRWALYIGSFSDRERARRQQRELAERQIEVAQVDSQLTIEGPLLVVVRSGLKAAEEVAAELDASRLRARIEIER